MDHKNVFNRANIEHTRVRYYIKGNINENNIKIILLCELTFVMNYISL